MSESLRIESPPRTMAAKLNYIGGEDVELRIPLLERLRACGFSVSASGSRTAEPFKLPGIEFFQYPLERGIHPLADRASQRALRELFLRQRPSIVHAFDTKPTILAMLAARAAQVPCRIRTITGMGYIFSSSSLLALSLRPIYCRLQRRAGASATYTIFQNRDDQAYFLANRMVDPNRQSVVLSSGIDVAGVTQRRSSESQLSHLRAELGIDQQVVVTMISRMVKHKGVTEFLVAARAVKQKLGSQVHFLLVGPLASEGRQAVDAQMIKSYRDAVQYLGPRQDISDLLAVSHLFVLPSYYREGVPRVLLEAGAMRLPLLTTDMPGCREVVRDGINGRIVPPRNAHQLAAAISELVCAKELRA
ncbi:MAG: glycosyltransferase family 4 protein, partial [Planctomycetales bacterium]|nr:glycosyltransferase family 4 protein [Planctomycetales bacterium]